MKDCRRARERITHAIEGRISVEELFELEEHARACPRCQRELDRARALEDALQALPAPPLERLDVERALEGIHARLASGENDLAPRSRRRRVLLAAAAAILLASIGSWMGRRLASRPAPPLTVTTAELAPPATDASASPDVGPAVTGPRSDVPTVPDDSVSFDPSAWSTDYDGTRHAWARGEIARILHESAAEIGAGSLLELGSSRESLAPFFDAFDRGARPLAAAGWPVLRLVQGQIGSEDALVSLAATRYVGARGDRGALRELALALTHEERKRAAALALADAGIAGLEELRAAFWDPELAPIVLAGLERASDGDALRWIDDLLREARRSAPSDSRRSLAALLPAHIASRRGAAARMLYSLAEHPLLARSAVLETFARVPGASAVLVQETESARSGTDATRDELLLAAIARLAPPECFEWVLRRARSAQDPAAALHALACYPGTPPTLALLELRSTSSRADEAAQLEAWRTALDLDPVRFQAIAADPWLITDPAELRRLLESLVLCEHPSAVPALLALASREELGDEDREGAVLAAGEVGLALDLPAFAALFAELDGREARLGAALVWSAFALAGEQGVRDLVARDEVNLLARLLERLRAPNARSRPASTLFQLARALEPWLERREPIAKESR